MRYSALLTGAALFAAPALLSCERGVRADLGEGVLRIELSRDTVVSAARGERDANLGGAGRLKTKGIVELTLFDADLESLRGRVIEEAILHARVAGEDPQRRVSVSTVASPWVEGTSRTYAPQPGAASFDWAEQGERHWAGPASDVTAVINGRGGTLWAFADAAPPDEDGWQRIALPPEVVAARVAGLSHGFALTDDVGHEYERRGRGIDYRIFPNRFLHSREAGTASAPFLAVRLGADDLEPPGEILFLPGGAEQPVPGLATLGWRTPEDRGAAGTLGFEVRISRFSPFEWERAKPVPRHLIPAAPGPGEPALIRIAELGLAPEEAAEVGVRAVDGAGNRGPVATIGVRGERAPLPLELEPAPPPLAAGEPPELAGSILFVADPLDKVAPEDGRTIPPRPTAYRRANHLWSGAERKVRLFAARNEFVEFQVVLDPWPADLSASLRFEDPVTGKELRVGLWRYLPVPSELGPLPDPLEPLAAGIGAVPSGPPGAAGSLLVEVYVPHEARPGMRRGRLALRSAGEVVDLEVELLIWGFTLPDHLSFVPQMNAYRLPPPAEMAYYRLAHEHRTCLNRLPYSWRGDVHSDYLPEERVGEWSWNRFDRRFGPLLDGSAFADLPRAGVPVDAFYLPLNENWPAPIEEGFRGGYWAEQALRDGYRRHFVEGARRLAEHLAARGWNDTLFEFYLNNKLSHRREDWGRSSAPWIFDEPVNTQDFWALRWYGRAFHEAVLPVLRSAPQPTPKLVFRADISRPQWRRDLLDGILDVHAVGSGFDAYLEWLLDRKRRFGEVLYHYGTTNRVEDSNVQAAAWCVRTWALGGDGVIPWQTIGGDSSWERASPLALFYPGRQGEPGPLPSIRLKAYRRGQQDVEYLTILALAGGRSRYEVGRQVLGLLELSSELEASGEEAGTLRFPQLDPARLWELRTRVGATLDRMRPPDWCRWVALQPPRRDPGALRDPAILPPPGL